MNLNIYAAMPLYKYMDAPCVQSLIGMMCDIFIRGDHFKIAFTQGQYVALARNEMYKHAVKLMDEGVRVDYILSLDHDHDYNAAALYELIAKIEKYDLPALSASYRMRGNRKYSMVRRGDDGVLRNITDDDLGTGVQKCEAVGFGFIVLRPQMVKTLIEKYKTPFVSSHDKYTGEDFHFCDLMRKEGFQVFYDADTVVGHYTSFFHK